MEVDIRQEVGKITQCLVHCLKIGKNSLCICGSGLTYEDCCFQKPEAELTYMGKALEATLKYKDSKGMNIEEIPNSLFKMFEGASLRRFKCLYPECNEKPISCHLIPENILRRCFGGHCLEFQVKDGSPRGCFAKQGIGDAGTLPVFCSTHDCELFKDVDQLNIDFSNKIHLFLLAFKAISFSLRRVQYLLGIDFQTALFTPALTLRNLPSQPAPGTHFELKVPYLEEQYARFVIVDSFFTRAMEALLKEDYDFFDYYNRNIPYGEDIFFAGFLNLSHDLEGNRINSAEVPIGIVCNFYTKDKQLHAVFACPDDPSKKAYAQFLQQLEVADEETFINVVNNILTLAAEKPLLPEGFSISALELKKIGHLRQQSQLCIKSSSSQILDLKVMDTAIRFISK